MTASLQRSKTEDFNINNFRKSILSWYDKNHRKMPWRAEPKTLADPYHEWLSEIMLQQTTVVTVMPYFLKFIEQWPTVHDLANTDREDVMREWAGLGYYARARNLYKCAQIVSRELGGEFPDNAEELKKLPGIGDYTAAAISAIAFGQPANVVDGNVERVMARIFCVKEPLPDSKKQLKELAASISLSEEKRPGDYAQGLMDLGATVCTPQSPKCLLCPVEQFCMAKKQGMVTDLPYKKKKKANPHKYGHLYWITDGDKILLETRDEKEMMGGMPGFPTSKWSTDIKLSQTNKLKVKHSFTHFDLTLEIIEDKHENGTIPPQNNHFWVGLSDLEGVGLPTLFKKAFKLMK